MNSKKLMLLLMSALLLVPVLAGTAAAQEAAVLELTGQLTVDDIQELNEGSARVYSHDGRVTFVDGSCTKDTVNTMNEAGEVVVSMIGLLGGDSRAQFEPWRTLTDAAGNKYFVFRQMYAGTAVLNGAVKVITDPDGKMTGFSASVETELPDVKEADGITAEEAEKAVLDHAVEINQPVRTVFTSFTDKMILPVALSVESDAEDAECRFVWVVYTDNPNGHGSRSAELPYLAHYVTMDGTYLYSLETIMPGDESGSTGFSTSYIFEFMEPVDYTGYVDLSDGTEKEISVTVMRDTRTGMYYLGNIERRIVVADCWEFLYNNGRVKLESSPDNLEWDQVGLLSFYNYCLAYDYYKAIGWTGGDGKNTPIMILNNFCDEKRVPVDNAAFMGNYLGWSLFAASYANDFSQCLDVIAHEFTHCVTGTVMTYNSYLNDFGAINEAMSDIHGQLCEMMNGATTDTTWMLGDNSLMPVRSMSDPHLFGQPEFTWDLYYRAPVTTPTGINDYGGVHGNSSLLNNVAYRLVNDGGMSLEEARSFWFAVDCAMVPGTDYSQLAELLPWVLKNQGLDQYETALTRAIDAVRMGIKDMPDFFDDDRALLKITLPDNENFTDGNWAMQVISVDLDKLIARATGLFMSFTAGDYSELPQAVQDMIEKEEKRKEEQEQKSFLELFFENLLDPYGEFAAVEEETESMEGTEAIGEWLLDEIRKFYFQDMSAAGQDGRTILMISRPGRVLPILMHLAVNESGTDFDQVAFAVFINGRWYPMGFPEEVLSEEEVPESDLIDQALIEELVNELVDELFSIRSKEDFLNLISLNVKGGEIMEIPFTGLEDFRLPAPTEETEDNTPVEPPIPGKKSRPKLD